MPDDYRLCLYVTATSPRSTRAIVNVRTLCDEHLSGRYELEVVDVARDPSVARSNQLLALPTLIKRLPLPERRFVGDMSQLDRLMRGLNLPLPPGAAAAE